mmetsp:Transcript_58720/g.67646  ORF Transcript_58720/g.67646 Transcript_58720/m.67646 type:complete len:92 (+) Transcript_58720:1-276(+)
MYVCMYVCVMLTCIDIDVDVDIDMLGVRVSCNRCVMTTAIDTTVSLIAVGLYGIFSYSLFVCVGRKTVQKKEEVERMNLIILALLQRLQHR